MTRKKVKLAYITNESARKATLKKRKRGLMKKVNELSTLCGVDACAIIYSPYDSQPEVWPSQMGAQRVVAQFKKMPEMEQSKKMVNQEGFIRQRITKASEQLKKQSKENREKEMRRLMLQCLTGEGLQGLSMMDLNDLGWLIDQNLKEIHKRLDSLTKKKVDHEYLRNKSIKAEGQVAVESAATATAAEENGAPVRKVEKNTNEEEMDHMDAIQRQAWSSFMDLGNPMQDLMGMGFGGDDMVLPFGDHSHNALWSNPFFP